MLGNILGDDGLAQRDENGMRRLAFVASIEFALPPIEQLDSAHWVGNFIAEIVRPTAVSVDVVKVLVEFLGQKPGNNIEVFVVVGGEPACVFLRGGGRAAGGRSVTHDFEFAGKKH